MTLPRLLRAWHGLLIVLLLAELEPCAAEDQPIVLRNVSAEFGVRVQHDNGTRGKHDLPEIMAGGVAVLDIDNDGWLDLVLCNGGPIGDPTGRDDPPTRLLRNQGNGTFRAVEPSPFANPAYAMGASAADYDGDGRDDLLLTGWGDQRLYRNVGGRFDDVTERAGLSSRLWSSSAAWADLDADGDLDLYIAGYLAFDPATAPYCAAPDGRRDYCAPEDFPAHADRLYRNNGDGTLTDVSRDAGIERPHGRGLGVLIADLIGDPRPDIFVANDGTPCWLFENRGGLRFREVGLEAGVAVDGGGNALAGMGVALGDVDGDGRSDLVVGNLFGRNTIAFQSLKNGLYHDASAALGLTTATRRATGFGIALVDLNADGWLDLFQANGHVLDRARLGTPFAMSPILLQNRSGRLIPTSLGKDVTWNRPILGRGLAVGDLDNDGRPDLVMNALDAPPRLLRNESPARGLSVELIGRRAQPFGARLKATMGGRTFVRDLPGGGSYLATSARTLWLPPCPRERLERVEVIWPSGQAEAWTLLESHATLRIVEGSGTIIKRDRPGMPQGNE